MIRNLILTIAISLAIAMFYYKYKYDIVVANNSLLKSNLLDAKETIERQNKAIKKNAIEVENMNKALLDIQSKPPKIRYKKIYKTIKGKNDCKDIKNNLDNIDTNFINSL